MPPPAKSRVTGVKNKKQSAKAQKERAKPAAAEETSAPASLIPLDLQQTLLNVFKNSFAERLQSDIQPLLQEVKGHLFNRDFGAAFGSDEYLEAYAARWSPSRALGYLDVLLELKGILKLEEKLAGPRDGENAELGSCKIVCLGGGAGAEIVTLGGLQKMMEIANEEEGKPKGMQVHAVALDIADWTRVVDQLSQHITSPPPISKYASAAVKAANVSLIDPSDLKTTFRQHDVLNMDLPTMKSLLSGTHLVTLMFTLNELYTASVALTQKFLLNMTSILESGAMLLVVDSPGSYSTIHLNGAEKNYPMKWLLDHTLLQDTSGGKEVEPVRLWEKIHEDESRWFRLDESLQFPIELENMRMQLHLYRKL
jgi:25S rRNA (uracil2843-N3)-methyltransferase